MNYVLTYLRANWHDLGLERYGSPAQLACLLVTPRFRASGHVVFLVLAGRRPAPILVAKVARLPGGAASIEREALNLTRLHASRAGGFDSIPKLVAWGRPPAAPFLLETALHGRAIDTAYARGRPQTAIGAVRAWLVDLHRATAQSGWAWDGGYEDLIECPLHQFAADFPHSPDEWRWLARTEELVAPLRWMDLPRVAAHGDLSHPNVLLEARRGLRVLDWELAETAGLPAVDLIFFITYVAFALRRRKGKARTSALYLSAFHEAFFAPEAWAAPHLAGYAEQLRLPAESLAPLFVACWMRYLTGLAARLREAEGAADRSGAETMAWLRSNRYYELWRYTVENFDALRFP